jgi:hypothetical protein
MNTDRLVEHLARDLRPAYALRAPWVRAGWWLVGAVAYLSMLALTMTSRADVAGNGGWLFLLGQIGAVATAAAAAIAAFASTVPGFSRRVLVIPIAAATVWLGGLAVGAVGEWNAAGVAGLAAPREWLCVVTIVLGGALPWLMIASMLRQGAPLAPRVTAALGALAVAALANIAACVSHPHPSSLVTLVWHGSTIVALIGLATAAANYVALSWEQRQQIARMEMTDV